MPQILHSTFENVLSSNGLPIESVVFSYVKYIFYFRGHKGCRLVCFQQPTKPCMDQPRGQRELRQGISSYRPWQHSHMCRLVQVISTQT